MLFIQYSGPARQCCYDEQGRLIRGARAGGHSDLSSVYSQLLPPSIAMTFHLQQDITPFIQCCKSNVTSCATFFSFRPSAESECQYNPPPPGMFYYAFNYTIVIKEQPPWSKLYVANELEKYSLKCISDRG